MDKTIGVLGGGQLGRMLTEAANRLNVKIISLDAENSPAKQINANPNHIIGSFADAQAIRQLAKRCDLITVEIEHVDTDVLQDLTEGMEMREDWRLVRSTKLEVQPGWRTIRIIQDKYRQKEHLTSQGIAVAKSIALEDGSTDELANAAKELGYPLMLKSRTEAYDGKGNFPVKSAEQIDAALNQLQDRPLYAEKWADFEAELAVMVVKTSDPANIDDWETSTIAYPVVETVHEDSICKLVFAPARRVLKDQAKSAQVLARRAIASFWGKGVFGVEMFLLKTGEILINEIAPRPHNSGHYTIEGCPISQYDAHIRAILDLPFPRAGTDFNTPNTNCVMLNLLGGAQRDSHLRAARAALSVPGARIHLYGKGDARPGRKMGHVTVIAASLEEAERSIAPLVETVDRIRAERDIPQTVSAEKSAASSKLSSNLVGNGNILGPPLVAVTMGSDSDRHVLKAGVDLLQELRIPHSVTITSAHRTPDRMTKFAKDAASKGVKVIIAAAGGAAHLPGMIAASTSLPVIGVPVKASHLDGLDSMLSVVQMPRGCPVATVGINNSNNAAQLAVRILGATDVTIRMRLEKYLADQTRTVVEKAAKMENAGIHDYEWID